MPLAMRRDHNGEAMSRAMENCPFGVMRNAPPLTPEEKRMEEERIRPRFCWGR